MRILLSAYACEPHRGSEPAVGLRVALVAASEHEVWVITRENNLPALHAYLETHPLRKRIHLVGIDLHGLPRRLKKRGGLLTMHSYYDLWQRRLASVAMSLDEDFDFDVVHHATFAAYWTRVGVAAVQKPLVLGPIGGGVWPPLGLLPVMGFRGGTCDLVRVLVRPLVARAVGARRAAKKAAIVLVQNSDTARLVGTPATTRVLSNALAAGFDLDTSITARKAAPLPHRLVASGRLLGWKGTELAIRAISFLENKEAILDIYGDGPQRSRLEKLVGGLNLGSRVHFHGTVPRHAVLAALKSASVLLHPALHDEASLAVAEALALGIPVVCLDRGGPPVVLRYWPEVPSRAVKPSTPGVTARRIATAIDEVMGQRARINLQPAEVFTDGILSAYVNATS